MAMSKEALRAYVHNPLLCRVIEQSREVGATRKALINAITVMSSTGVSQVAIISVEEKLDEYEKVQQACWNVLEDVWGVTWHNEYIIAKYINWPDADINELPDWIKE